MKPEATPEGLMRLDDDELVPILPEQWRITARDEKRIETREDLIQRLRELNEGYERLTRHYEIRPVSRDIVTKLREQGIDHRHGLGMLDAGGENYFVVMRSDAHMATKAFEKLADEDSESAED